MPVLVANPATGFTWGLWRRVLGQYSLHNG